MKRLLLTFAFLAALASCQKTNPDSIDPEQVPDIPADSVLVSLRAELDVQTEPLTKAGDQKDLYGIRIYQFLDNYSTSLVAYGTFDDLEKAVVKMSKAYKYGIDVLYIQDGKEIVHQYDDGHYGHPFDAYYAKNGALNEVVYTKPGDDPCTDLAHGRVQEKGMGDMLQEPNLWTKVKVYKGIAMCNPAEQSSVNVKLYSQMIGFRVSISEFESGKVTISGLQTQEYSAEPDAGHNGLIDIVVCMENLPTIVDAAPVVYGHPEVDPIQYVMEESNTRKQDVMLVYTDDAGNRTTLYYFENFSVERNTRYIMSFSLSDAVRNGGVQVETVEDGEMVEANLPVPAK